MCVVSMIGDEFQKRWWPDGFPQQQQPQIAPIDWEKILRPPPTRDEFDALKREVELMRDLLKAAKEYDERNKEPHCEMDEKVALLKAMAKMMGVDLSEIFKDEKK